MNPESEKAIRRLAAGENLHLSAQQCAALQKLGLGLSGDEQSGWRWTAPCELFDANAIIESVGVDVVRHVQSLHTELITDSTNEQLRRLGSPQPGQVNICIAEMQSAGKGRRGRDWVSPLGSGLCLSISAVLPDTEIGGSLSLGVGVAVVSALQELGLRDLVLKWPNDVLWQDKKLAGVLVEIQQQRPGWSTVITGVGLNIRLQQEQRQRIAAAGGAEPTDLFAADLQLARHRNELAAAVIRHLVTHLRSLAAGPPENQLWRDRWTELDGLCDRQVVVAMENHKLSGRACGVDADGALMVDDGNSVHRVVSGEVSVRLKQ